MSTVRIDTSGLDRLIAELDGDMQAAIRAVAFKVEGEAKTRTPVDTGALKNSIQAKAKGGKRWIVADGVEYGIYQELGTHKMASQPFMVPAMLHVMGELVHIFADEILD